MRVLLLGAALAVLASGCGQKGPLYFRDSPPPGVEPPRPQTYEPVPYPEDATKKR